MSEEKTPGLWTTEGHVPMDGEHSPAETTEEWIRNGAAWDPAVRKARLELAKKLGDDPDHIIYEIISMPYPTD